MNRALFAAVLALLPGCDRVFGLERPPPGPDAPEPPDAPPIDARACFGNGALTLCLVGPVGPPLVAAAPLTTTIDTSDPLACAEFTGDQPDLCVVAAEKITIDGKLRAIGPRPLVLVTPGKLTIGTTGTIDLTGDFLIAAAGSQPSECVDGSDSAGSAGGAGGSFGGRGGNGGSGNGGLGGTASAAVSPTTLRGGCKGRAGANIGARAGFGGGAVAIFAGAEIEVSGTINASGSFGKGGAGGANPGRGGGGGGSGGMIVLDAPLIVLSPVAQVFANGGGGGEGGGNPAAGNDGADPTAWDIVAAGGAGGSSGGDGGAGSVGVTPAMNGGGSGSVSGGGGGGGGAGVIRVVSGAVPVGHFSPPPEP